MQEQKNQGLSSRIWEKRIIFHQKQIFSNNCYKRWRESKLTLKHDISTCGCPQELKILLFPNTSKCHLIRLDPTVNFCKIWICLKGQNLKVQQTIVFFLSKWRGFGYFMYFNHVWRFHPNIFTTTLSKDMQVTLKESNG